MHGRPRVKAKDQDPERVRAAQQKGALLGQLSGEVLQRRRAQRYDPASLALSANLLELNPEVYTVWNYRREALASTMQAGGEPAVAAVAAELALTQRSLARNPKSYATWHHRRWVVATGFCSLEHEIVLVEKLLVADERNFHGWAYRAFVAGRMGMPAERELEFTRRKIEQNFSNYSAWHYRTALLPAVHAAAPAHAAARAPGDLQPKSTESGGTAEAVGASAAASAVVPAAVLDEEYELVKQACYTEPEDQSGWFYHRWLLGCSLARYHQACGGPSESAEQSTLLRVLSTQAAMCHELLDIEPGAKWPLLTLTRLRELQAQLADSMSTTAPTRASSQCSLGEGVDGGEGETAAQEVQAGYAELAALDPMRAGFYQDAAAGQARVVSMPQVPGAPHTAALHQ